MTRKFHKDPIAIRHAEIALADLKIGLRGVTHATILSDDGFEVSRLKSSAPTANRIPAMASSMQALGDAVSRELQTGTCDYVIVAASEGYTVILRVPGMPLVLAAGFDDNASIGQALAAARDCAEAMGKCPPATAAASAAA